jgi:hypothetical protein
MVSDSCFGIDFQEWEHARAALRHSARRQYNCQQIGGWLAFVNDLLIIGKHPALGKLPKVNRSISHRFTSGAL